MNSLLYIGDKDRIFRGLDGLEGFEARRFESVEGALEEVSLETDAVVGSYSAVRDTLNVLFTSVREKAPDANIVLLSEGRHEGFDYRGDAVFDFISTDGMEAEEVVESVRETVETRTQTAYPVPEREDERIQEVRRYTPDADGEVGFDRLTRIAKSYFEAEWSFVALVEKSSEVFLSCHGIDIDEIPREESVCTFQILDDGQMVVEDTEEDTRLEGHEIIYDLNLRSYAGAPLITPSGARIGSFCVMDTEPRVFDEDDREMLRLFAEEAMDKLVSHKGSSGAVSNTEPKGGMGKDGS